MSKKMKMLRWPRWSNSFRLSWKTNKKKKNGFALLGAMFGK